VSGGLHGVGVSVVNALSEKLTVTVVRDGTFNTMSFAKGIPQTQLSSRKADSGSMRGTIVFFIF
jgi:DNA gyrase/topoisomerase IV subunit B